MVKLTDQEQVQRDVIYNQLMQTIAGANPLPAIMAVADVLAVAVVDLVDSDREKAHDTLDRLLPGMKMTADNNLDRMAEEKQLSARRGVVGHA